MNRRLFEVVGGVGAAGIAGLTAYGVPFTRLGAWSLGTLGPLVVIGMVVGVTSWPWQRGAIAGELPPGRTPWRLLYLVPLVCTAAVAPLLVREPPAGLKPALALGLFALIGYSALLAGLAAFLVIVLPWTLLVGSLMERLRGGRVSPYIPLGALLLLTITGAAVLGALALDGLPNAPAGLVLLVAALVGVVPDGVTVTSGGLLVAARVCAGLLVATVIALFVVGRDRADRAARSGTRP